ncbi:unnamed protein product, partial [marine sediment metagenome]
MSTLGLLSKVPMYMSFRRWGWPKLLPFSLVISVCYRCNSRCRTCNVWKKQADELTLEEWDRVFANIGRTPYYLTFTGGEPFLRRDLVDLVGSAYQHCHPGVITLPPQSPPGVYFLEIGLYDDDGERLSLSAAGDVVR